MRHDPPTARRSGSAARRCCHLSDDKHDFPSGGLRVRCHLLDDNGTGRGLRFTARHERRGESRKESLVCHSERSEESMPSRRASAWILRCAQNDREFTRSREQRDRSVRANASIPALTRRATLSHFGHPLPEFRTRWIDVALSVRAGTPSCPVQKCRPAAHAPGYNVGVCGHHAAAAESRACHLIDDNEAGPSWQEPGRHQP